MTPKNAPGIVLHYLANIMPSRKKKSKAKGRKPAAGKGGADKVAENASAVDQQKKGTPLDSEMQRLRIDKQQEEDALLEEAIKLAAVEEQEMKVKEKGNCTHGYNPSSRFQARFCEDYLKTFTESYHASTPTRGNSQSDRVRSFVEAFSTASSASTMTTNGSRDLSNKQCINPFCLAEGTKFILDEKSDDARLPALLALITKSAHTDGKDVLLDCQKMLELFDGDEHTLFQFFRKRIPCSCLDEKYKQVKSIPKMGICYNDNCPLPDHMAIRSKMLRCTQCSNINYC